MSLLWALRIGSVQSVCCSVNQRIISTWEHLEICIGSKLANNTTVEHFEPFSAVNLTLSGLPAKLQTQFYSLVGFCNDISKSLPGLFYTGSSL